MKQTTLGVKVTYITPMLATASGEKELLEKFLQKPTLDAEKKAEEIATLPLAEQVEKGSTVFHRDDKGIFVWDYTWRGFIKEQIQMGIELGEFTKLNPWNFRKAVDGCIYVQPRRIYFSKGTEILKEPMGAEGRPIRVVTMQGERVALARSERVDEDITQEFEVMLLESENPKSAWKELTVEVLENAFYLGRLKGRGQWRSGGWGRFEAVVTVLGSKELFGNGAAKAKRSKAPPREELSTGEAQKSKATEEAKVA